MSGKDKNIDLFLGQSIAVAHGTSSVHYSLVYIACLALGACAETRVHFGNCTVLLEVYVCAVAWLRFRVDPAVREVKIRTGF